MRENTARACRQERANYQNCNILRCVPSVFSGGTVLLSGSSAPRKIVDEFILLKKQKRSLFRILCKYLFSEVAVQAVTELDNKAAHCHTP
ncbi:hypothetical protein MP845_09195, partial [Escherichia coli]|nr:hypothetical protein [Escherichia coli]